MSIVTAVERIPLKMRLLASGLYVAAIASLGYAGLIHNPLLWISVAAAALFVDRWYLIIFEDNYCQNILHKIRIQDGYVIVGSKRQPVEQVRRIVLHQVCSDRGFISFPFNPAVSYRFPVEQIEPLKTYLQSKLPEAELTE